MAKPEGQACRPARGRASLHRADAEAALEQIFTVEYGQTLDLCKGVKIRFRDAGHLLGSSIVEIWAQEGEVSRKLVFSGDLGNVDQPIIGTRSSWKRPTT